MGASAWMSSDCHDRRRPGWANAYVLILIKYLFYSHKHTFLANTHKRIIYVHMLNDRTYNSELPICLRPQTHSGALLPGEWLEHHKFCAKCVWAWHLWMCSVFVAHIGMSCDPETCVLYSHRSYGYSMCMPCTDTIS